ncbi:protein PF14_0175-like [Penaeus japonicus]|uniref:protein PF14_0175-like n=1 Tax=Penaeus japonicus TaxID=27405 RepID=UPI001C711566|nr:protein PF14_0175-like [Penaeus japonicus]
MTAYDISLYATKRDANFGRPTFFSKFERPSQQDLQTEVKNQFESSFARNYNMQAHFFENSHPQMDSNPQNGASAPESMTKQGPMLVQSIFLQPELMQNEQLTSVFQQSGQSRPQIIQNDKMRPQYEGSQIQHDTNFVHLTLPDNYLVSQTAPNNYLSRQPLQTFGQRRLLKNIRPQTQQQNDLIDLQTQQSTTSVLLRNFDGQKNLQTDHIRRIGIISDSPKPQTVYFTRQTQQNGPTGKQIQQFSDVEFQSTNNNFDSQQLPNAQGILTTKRNSVNTRSELPNQQSNLFQQQKSNSFEAQKSESFSSESPYLPTNSSEGTIYSSPKYFYSNFDSQSVEDIEHSTLQNRDSDSQNLPKNQARDQINNRHFQLESHTLPDNSFLPADRMQIHTSQSSKFQEKKPFANQFYEQNIQSDNQFYVEQNASHFQHRTQHSDNLHLGHMHDAQFQPDNLHGQLRRDNPHIQSREEFFFENGQIHQQKSVNSKQNSPQNQQFHRHMINNPTFPQEILPNGGLFQKQSALTNNQFPQEALSNNNQFQLQLLPNNSQFQQETLTNNQFQQQNIFSKNQFHQEILPHNTEFHQNLFNSNQFQHETQSSHQFREGIKLNNQVLQHKQEQSDPLTLHNSSLKSSVIISQDKANSSLQVQNKTSAHLFTSVDQQNGQLESFALLHAQSERDIPHNTESHPHNLDGGIREERNSQNSRLDPLVLHSGLIEQQSNQRPLSNPHTQSGIIASFHNQVNNLSQVQSAIHNPQFTTTERQIELLESFFLPSERPEMPQTFQSGSQIMIKGQSEQESPQTQSNQPIQNIGLREQRNTQHIPHIQGGGSAKESHPQNLQSNPFVLEDSHIQGSGLRDRRNPLTNIANPHTLKEQNHPQSEHFTPQTLHSEFALSTGRLDQENDFLNDFESQGMKRIHSENTVLLKNHPVSANSDTLPTIHESHHSDQHNFQVSHGQMESQNLGNIRFNVQEDLDSENRKDFSIQNQINANNASFQIQNIESQNRNNFGSLNKNLEFLDIQNQNNNFQTHNQKSFQPENLNSHDQNQNDLESQNQNNFHLQNQNRNSFQNQNLSHNSFTTQINDQNNFHIQTQTQNSLQLQSQNQNHFQNQNQNYLQNQNQNSFQPQNQSYNNDFDTQSQIKSENIFQFLNLNQNNSHTRNQNQNAFIHQITNQFLNKTRNVFLNQNQNVFLNHSLSQNEDTQSYRENENNFLNLNRNLNRFETQTQNQNNLPQNQSKNLNSFTNLSQNKSHDPNQNNFQSKLQNQNNFSQIQTQNIFQSQLQTQNTFQSPLQNENHSPQNQNNFLNQNMNQNHFQSQLQNQNNFQIPSKNQNDFLNQNENQLQSQNNFQSQVQSPINNQDDFLNQNQNQNNFESQPQSQSEFQSQLQSQSDFQSQLQSQSDFQSQLQSQNNFQSQVQSPINNQDDFLNQNQNQNHFESQPQSQSAFQPQLQSQSDFQPQLQSQSDFQPQLQSQSDFQPQLQSQSNFQSQNQNLLNVGLEEHHLEIGSFETHPSQNQSLTSKFKIGFQNQSLRERFVTDNPLNIPSVQTLKTGNVLLDQSDFESIHESPNLQNNFGLINNQKNSGSHVQHNINGNGNFKSKSLFESQNVHSSSGPQNIQNSFDSISIQSNFAPQNVYSNFDSNIQNNIGTQNVHSFESNNQSNYDPKIIQRDSNSQITRNDADFKNTQTIVGTQILQTKFQAQNSSVGSDSSQINFKQPIKGGPVPQNIQNSFSFGHIQNQFESQNISNNFNVQDPQDNSNSQYIQGNVQGNPNSQNIQNNFFSKNVQDNFEVQQISNNSSQYSQSNLGSQNIPGNFDSKNVQSDNHLHNTQHNFFSQNVRSNFDSHNIPNSNTESLGSQNLGKSLSESTTLQNKPPEEQKMENLKSQNLEIGNFRSQNLEVFESELKHLQSGLFQPPIREFNHFQSQNIQHSFDFQNHQINSDSQVLPSTFNSQNFHNNFRSDNSQIKSKFQNIQSNFDIQTIQSNSGSLNNQGNAEHHSQGKSLSGLKNLQNGSFERQNPENSNLGSLKNNNFDSQNLEKVDFTFSHNIQANSASPNIQSNFNSKNTQSHLGLQTIPNNFVPQHLNNSDSHSQNLQSNKSIQDNINTQNSYSNSESQNQGSTFSESNIQQNSNLKTRNVGYFDSELRYLQSGLFQPPIREYDHFQSQNTQSNFDLQSQSNINSQIPSIFTSQNVRNDVNSHNNLSNFDLQNTNLELVHNQSNLNLLNYQSNIGSQFIPSDFSSQNLHSNFNFQNIQSNSDSHDIQRPNLGKALSESNNLQNNSSSQKMKSSNIVNLESNNFSSENQENVQSQSILSSFHSQNADNNFDSHNIQTSQNIQGSPDTKIIQNINLRHTAQNLGKSLSESTSVQNGSLEQQKIVNGHLGNVKNDHFQSQNLQNNNFQIENMENGNFQLQNRQNNNIQSLNLENIGSEFTHLLSGQLQPPTREFNYFETHGIQSNFDTQNFQKNLNPQYTQTTFDLQKSQINTGPLNLGKRLSDHSESINSQSGSLERQLLENNDSDDLENNNANVQNLDILQTEQEHLQKGLLQPPLREYDYFESQNKENIPSQSNLKSNSNPSSQNTRNVESASRNQQPEHFPTENAKRSPPMSQGQGVFTTQNQARSDFLNVNFETQNTSNSNILSNSFLIGHPNPQKMVIVNNKRSQNHRVGNLESSRNFTNNRTQAQDQENYFPEPQIGEKILREDQNKENSETVQLQNQTDRMTQQSINIRVQVMGNHDIKAHNLDENSTESPIKKIVLTQSQTPFFNSFEPMRLQNGDNSVRSNVESNHFAPQTADLHPNSENVSNSNPKSQNLQSNFRLRAQNKHNQTTLHNHQDLHIQQTTIKTTPDINRDTRNTQNSRTGLQSSVNSQVRPRIQLNGHALPHNMHLDLLSHTPHSKESVEALQGTKNDQLPPSQQDQSQNSQQGHLRPQSQHDHLQSQNIHGQLQQQINHDIPFPLPDQQNDQIRAQSKQSNKLETQIPPPEQRVKTGQIFFSREAFQEKQLESQHNHSHSHTVEPQYNQSQITSKSKDGQSQIRTLEPQQQTESQAQYQHPQTDSHSQIHSQSRHKQSQRKQNAHSGRNSRQYDSFDTSNPPEGNFESEKLQPVGKEMSKRIDRPRFSQPLLFMMYTMRPNGK